MFEAWQDHKFVLLTTYRKSGKGVGTPLWFVIQNGKLYFRTSARSGKVKRLKNDKRVMLAPCTGGGKKLGDAVMGQARWLSADEAVSVEADLSRRYGLQKKLVDFVLKFKKTHFAYFEITAT